MSIRGRGDGDDDDEDEGTLKEGEIKQTVKNNSFDLINYMNSELSNNSSSSMDRAAGDPQAEGLQMQEVSMEDLIDLIQTNSQMLLDIECERGCCNNGVDCSEWALNKKIGGV